MPRQEMMTMDAAVAQLLAEHAVEGDRYQTYKNAEAAAWKCWTHYKKDATPEGTAWRAVAEAIGTQYHAVHWEKS